MSELSQKLLGIAISQIGKEENPRGSNWGKTGDPVPEYLRSVGITFPASWCMAFVYWCACEALKVLVKAGIAKWIPNMQSYNPLVRTGGVLNQWKLIHSEFKVPAGEDPQPGDIGIMDHGHGLGHTFVVESFDKASNQVHTVEGNTNDEGVREGYEVCRRVRKNQKPIIGYIRI